MANTPIPTNLDVDIWASTAVEPDLKLSPNNAKYAQGWVVELARVDYENYIQGRQDQAIANIVENGVPHWETTITYERQSTVRSPIDSYAYVAINNGISGGSDPSADVSGNWIRQDRFTPDSLTQNVQTFADSSLEFVNFSVSTLVMNVDGSNLDTLSNNSLIANRDFSNVTGTSQLSKLSSSNAITLSVINDKVNIDAPVIRSVAKDYISGASDANTLSLTAVANEEAPTNYFDEMSISFRYPQTFTENTGTVSLNLNGLGVVELADLLGNSLTAGAIRNDDHLLAVYEFASSKFLITSNRSEEAGIYGSFIAHSIPLVNLATSNTTTAGITLTGTPLEHCKILLVQSNVVTTGSDATGTFSAGVRLVSAPLISVAQIHLNISTDLVDIGNANQIEVTQDDLELFATNGAFTAGAPSASVEIIGGYR